MSKKLIALDDGHGMETAGKRTPTLPNGEKSETGNFMHENEFNRAVVKYLKTELENNGFGTLLVAPTDADTSLSVRTNTANAKGADLYISVHANANTSKWGDWGGIETYCYPSESSKKLANLVHKQVMKGTKFKDRGVKDGSHLWVIRKAKMPSILLELGFMDSKEDYKHLLSDDYRRECATEVAQGVCEYYGVTYKGAKVSPTPAKTTASTEKKETPKKEEAKKDVIQLVYKKVLKSGSKGEDVKALQKALNELNFKVGTADGIYGAKTMDAVERFQKVYLPKEVDGIAGKNTIKEMNTQLKK